LKRLIPIILLLIIGVAIYRSQQRPKAREQLNYSGVVEVTTVDESFEVSGRLKSISVHEGDSVKAGQELARLDDALAQANLKQAQARVGAAKARLDQLLAGSRNEEIAQASARLEQAQADVELLSNGPTAPELETAEAQMRASRSRAELLQQGYRQEDISAAQSQRQAALSNMDTMKKEYNRANNLFKEGAISDQQLESRKNSYDQALSAYQAADQNATKLQRGLRSTEIQSGVQDYRASQARYANLAQGSRPEQIAKAEAILQERGQALQLLRQGPRKEEIQAARQQYNEAKSALEASQVMLAKTKLLASSDGVVLTRNLEPGEAVNPGQSVVSVADSLHPWVNIYVPEYELPKIHLGQAGAVSADGLDKPLQGKIVRISEKSEFTPKFIQTERERVNLVFRAKFSFENSALSLRGGMPADVKLSK
jgi:HlyD family secretion protein